MATFHEWGAGWPADGAGDNDLKKEEMEEVEEEEGPWAEWSMAPDVPGGGLDEAGGADGSEPHGADPPADGSADVVPDGTTAAPDDSAAPAAPDGTAADGTAADGTAADGTAADGTGAPDGTAVPDGTGHAGGGGARTTPPWRKSRGRGNGHKGGKGQGKGNNKYGKWSKWQSKGRGGRGRNKPDKSWVQHGDGRGWKRQWDDAGDAAHGHNASGASSTSTYLMFYMDLHFFHQSNNSIYLAKKGKHIWMFSCPSQAAVAREQAKRLQSPTGPTEGRSSLRRPASLRLIGPVTQLATRMAGADAMLREATNLATSSFRSLAQVDSELLLVIVPMSCVGIQSRWNPMRTV